MADYKEEFRAILSDGGLPTTEYEVDAVLDQAIIDSGVTINNSSPFSPFMRAIKALVRIPAMWLIEALVVSVLPNMFVKTATGLFLEFFAWELGLERKPPSKLKGVVTYSRVDTSAEVQINLGDLIQTGTINGKVYKVIVTESAIMADGVGSISVAVEAEEEGAGYNLGSGYFKNLLEPLSGVTVTNEASWITSPGADKESNEDLRLRCRNQFTALNQFHTDAVYTKIVTEFAGIGVNNVFYNSDAPRGPGTANIYILMDSGEPEQTLLDSLQYHIMDDGNHGHGDDLLILAMPDDGVTQDLTATVSYLPNLSLEQKNALVLSVEAMIKAAFRQNNDYIVTTTMPHDTFSFSLLSSEIFSQLSGLKSVEFDVADITTTLSVHRLNSLTVVDA